MFERIRQMLIKEFIQVFRDPRMRAVIFIVPCMEVLVIGYAVNMDIRDIRTAVYDLDNTPGQPRASGPLLRQRLFRRGGPGGRRPADARPHRPQRGADRVADQPRLCRRPGGRADRRHPGDLRRHRFQHGGHRHELRQPHHRRLCRGRCSPSASSVPRAWPTRPCGSISAAGRGSTRTWRAATTSCPA